MWIILHHKLSLWASLIVLGSIAIFTVFACAKWGIETGLTIGLLAFLLVGGFESTWYLLTRRLERRIDEHVEQDQISRSIKASENNPTIR
jgi:hypothetical protein